MSHPIPLHPDDSLERALGDMRQSVAARRDEGWVDRVLMAGIWLALLSILDTLIGLLADFRAGKLPPVVPARDRSAVPADREPAGRPATPPPALAGEVAARPGAASSRLIPTPGDAAPSDAATGTPVQCPVPAPDRPEFPLAPPPLAHPPPGQAPRGIAFHPSRVPRPPVAPSAVRGNPRPATGISLRYRFITPAPPP